MENKHTCLLETVWSPIVTVLSRCITTGDCSVYTSVVLPAAQREIVFVSLMWLYHTSNKDLVTCFSMCITAGDCSVLPTRHL